MATKQGKTDNASLAAKLLLRRHFLAKYHAVPPRVLDCCQGSGILWGRLKKEFPLATYCGLDVKPKKGRLQIHSERFLAAGGWSADVVDVDTYGSPWKHWLEILKWAPGSITVFLTHGTGYAQNGVGGALDKIALAAAGLTFQTMKLPMKLPHLHAIIVPYCIWLAVKHGWTIDDCLEVRSVHAQYLGVRLEKPVAASSPIC